VRKHRYLIYKITNPVLFEPMTPDTTPDLTQRQRRHTITALLSSAFIVGIALGGLAPMLALVMESRGVAPVLIGFNSAMSPIGVIAASFLTPALITRLGPFNAQLLGYGIIVVAILLLSVFSPLPVWFALRFMMGVGLAIPWVVSESWLNMATLTSSRGRIMALYTMILALGFAAGPLVVAGFGSTGVAPYLVYALLVALSTLPLFLIRHLTPNMDMTAQTGSVHLILSAPTIFGAAMLAGFTDAATFSFLPLYGLRLGFHEGYAVTLLSLFLAGNLLLQYPIGWLADHVSRRAMLLFCAVVCFLGPALIPLIYASPVMLAGALFIWGGCAWATYGVALTMLGDRFPGSQLTAANAAFIMAFEIANVIGPPASGYALGQWPPHGLMFLMASIGALYFLLTAARGLIRRLWNRSRCAGQRRWVP